MSSTAGPTTNASSAEPRPRDNELDLYGITHIGLVRTENEDQFLLCTVHPQVVIHATSLPSAAEVALPAQRLATLMLVADGVGGSVAGQRASEIATAAVTRYVAESLRCFHALGEPSEVNLVETLRAAAIEAHRAVLGEASQKPEEEGMATTLSLAVVVWPWMYVVQVGDSRCYVYHNGKLEQITRDQTYAQDLVQQGVFTPQDAERSPLNQVLSSAIGAEEAVPEVTRVDVRERGTVILLCTDGLTKHVSDAEIAEQLAGMKSGEQVCRALLQLVLDRGASDNVTMVVGRALKRTAPGRDSLS